MPANDVIRVARGELGKTEHPPGSNHVTYWNEYDKRMQGQPWCVCFLWWCFQHAGEGSAFFGGAKTASCGTLYRWYKEQGLTVPKHDARPGDIVILNFRGTADTQHCGLVVDAGANWVQTIEGNTSPGLEGSQDNGGCVAAKIRTMAQIVGVCRPTYKEEPMPPETDYETHWAHDEIDRAMELGLVRGYPDGSFKPDQPITRAEAAVLILRLYDKIMGVQ